MTVTEPGVIYSAQYWPTNAHMIVDCARLGYLRKEWYTFDATYGQGTFWKLWQPDHLHKNDLNSNIWGISHDDFTDLPWTDGIFDAVVYDPPYKLNGTPDYPDIRYGVQMSTRWQDRIKLMLRGLKECARVTKPKGFLLVKCMDQVVSGKVVWQTDIMSKQAAFEGMTKVDRLDFLTQPRQQPHARQIHARRNYSTLLVFQK